MCSSDLIFMGLCQVSGYRFVLFFKNTERYVLTALVVVSYSHSKGHKRYIGSQAEYRERRNSHEGHQREEELCGDRHGKMVRVDLALIMEYGYNIPASSRKVQERVKSAIENMTGLEVSDVNIRIAGVNMQKDR